MATPATLQAIQRVYIRTSLEKKFRDVAVVRRRDGERWRKSMIIQIDGYGFKGVFDIREDGLCVRGRLGEGWGGGGCGE